MRPTSCLVAIAESEHGGEQVLNPLQLHGGVTRLTRRCQFTPVQPPRRRPPKDTDALFACGAALPRAESYQSGSYPQALK